MPCVNQLTQLTPPNLKGDICTSHR